MTKRNRIQSVQTLGAVALCFHSSGLRRRQRPPRWRATLARGTGKRRRGGTTGSGGTRDQAGGSGAAGTTGSAGCPTGAGGAFSLRARSR